MKYNRSVFILFVENSLWMTNKKGGWTIKGKINFGVDDY